MPKPSGAGSYLSNLAAARKRVDQTRQLLGMGERGVQTTSRPLPPQQPPTSKAAPQQASQPTPVPDERMQTLYNQTAEVLRQAKMGQQGAAPYPQEPTIQTPDLTQQPVEQVLSSVQAQTVPLATQFYRIAGRPGSPRELSILATRVELERELGRAPTLAELKLRITQPVATQARPGAIEG